MNLYDAAVRALHQGQAIRRPSMPQGLMIVPVGLDPMRSFLTSTDRSRAFEWHATLDDLVAADWMVADWRAGPAGRLACGRCG